MQTLTISQGNGPYAFFNVEKETAKALKVVRTEKGEASKYSFWIPKSALKASKIETPVDLGNPEKGTISFIEHTLKPWFRSRMDSYQRMAFHGGFD